MNTDFSNFHTVNFLEHPNVDMSQKTPHHFDITASGFNFHPSFISNDAFNMDGYNWALIYKITHLPILKIPDFLHYQCSLVMEPVNWLDQLESLITLNYESLIENSACIPNIHKLYINIQPFRLQYKQKQESILAHMHYNATEIPSDAQSIIYDLSVLTTPFEKKAYLINLRADILENYIIQKPYSLIKFIDIEYERIEKLEKLGVPPKGTNNQNKKTKQNVKIKIYGHLNVFIDFFYQLLFEYQPMGRPYLDAPPSAIADLIVDQFLNSEGDPISHSTVLTILSPGKSDKRPSIDKKIKLRDA